VTSTAKPITDRMKGRDWLMTQDWSDDEIELALDTADQLKKEFKSGVPTLHLANKTEFLIFFDKSTRTRNSFEAGMTQLGGHAHFIDSETSQIAHGESPKDMGIILSGYGTIREEFGKDLSELKIAVSWAYAPSYVKPMSVPQGLIMLMLCSASRKKR